MTPLQPCTSYPLYPSFFSYSLTLLSLLFFSIFLAASGRIWITLLYCMTLTFPNEMSACIPTERWRIWSVLHPLLRTLVIHLSCLSNGFVSGSPGTRMNRGVRVLKLNWLVLVDSHRLITQKTVRPSFNGSNRPWLQLTSRVSKRCIQYSSSLLKFCFQMSIEMLTICVGNEKEPW